MRLRKPIVALSTAGLLALAACGGGSSDSGSTDTSKDVNKDTLGNTGNGQDPTAEGPVTIPGAQKGGTVTVLTSTGLTTPIDPSDLYYTDTNGIMTSLVTRSLTQYRYDEKTKQMILVPDIATDLGTPNSDYTSWTFTIRDGVKWETGDPVTADDVAFGISRGMDNKTFPNGPGLYYSNPYFATGDTYKGPYTDKGKLCTCVTVDGNKITIKMSKPFPDLPYYASFPAMGPIPQDKSISDPAKYRQHPMSTGPHKIKEYTPSKTLVLERNDQWDPATDPARTAYPDAYNFKAGQDLEKTDQILLADTGEGQTTLTYDDVLAQDYRKFKENGRIVLGGSPCTYFISPDYRKIKDKEVRQAIAWAYPYKDAILAGGLIPDVTAIPASQLMPPGIPGRETYNAVPGHGDFETDPEKAKQLLQQSGNEGFEIKFLWRTDNPINTQTKDVLIKALEKAGFKATAVPTTEAKYVEDRDDVNSDINYRTYGWCSDWPSGATWIPPIFQSTDLKTVGFGTNEAGFNEPSIDQKINDVFSLDADKQPAAWQALENEVMTKYFPIVPQYYTGVAQAHGSKINGHFDDNTLGTPTFRNIWISQ